MVPISPAWRDYYTELEPERRAQILQRNLREEAEDGANAYRQRLFSLRYMEEGKKEVSQFLKESGYLEAASYGEAGEAALYWEIRNTAKRYFKTCMGSEYRRSLFGLLSPNGADQKKQMCKDVWRMTLGLEKRFDLSDELKLWTKAVHDEYILTDPRASEQLQEMSRSMERG